MTRGFIIDAAERVAWTALQAFAATLLASGFFDGLGLSLLDSLKIAALAAGAATLKSFLALGIGSSNTAQLGPTTYANADDGALDGK